MNVGRGEQRGLKTNLLENTITVRFRKCPQETIYHAAFQLQNPSASPILHTTFLAIDEASMH